MKHHRYHSIPGLRKNLLAPLLASVIAFTGVTYAQDMSNKIRETTPAENEAIAKALPPKLLVKPQKPRKILVFSTSMGYYHQSTPLGIELFKLVQDKLGGYTFTFTEKQEDFRADNLKNYDAIIFNNCTHVHRTITDEQIQKDVVNYVLNGGGLMGIHAAADGGWPEFNELLGSKFAGHPWGSGETHPFIVEEPTNPLASVFGGETFKLKDEIYVSQDPFFSRDKARVLLSMDLSDPVTAKKPEGNTKRADQDYAVSTVQRDGKGRAFYTSFGHNDEVYFNPAVVAHYIAGLQYVAGDLSAPDAPIALLDRLKRFKGPLYHEAALKIWKAIEDAKANGDTAKVEADLAAVLADPKSSEESKAIAIEGLGVIATPKSLQLVTSLVGNPELAHYALAQLSLRLSADDFSKVLATMPARLPDPSRVNLVNTMTYFGPKFAPIIARFTQDPNAVVKMAATEGLGAVGTAAEAQALMKLQGDPRLLALRDSALIRIASRADAASAVPILQSILSRKDSGPAMQGAALAGIAAKNPALGKTLVFQYLGGADEALARAALYASSALVAPDVTQQLATVLPKLSPQLALAAVFTIAQRKDPQVPAILEKLLPTESIQPYVLEALGQKGTAAQVPALVPYLTNANSATAKAAIEALSAIHGKGVDEAIVNQLNSAPGNVQAELLKVCAERQTAALAPAVMKLCSSSDSAVANQAFKAIAVCGTRAEFLALCQMAAAPSGFPQSMNVAVSKLGTRLRDDKFVADTLIASAQKAPPANQAGFVQLLGTFRTPEGLAYLEKQLQGSDAKIEYEAVKSLSRWETSAPVNALLAVCTGGKSDNNKTLAFAGVSSLTAADPGMSPASKLDVFSNLLKIAANQQQTVMVLQGLGKIADTKAQALIEPYLQNENAEVAAAAKSAISNSYLEMTKVKWTFESNFNNKAEDLQKLIDQDIETRWTTSASMTDNSPMFLIVDLGYEQDISSITLDATPSAGDYPRKYEIYVSNDKEDFGSAAMSGSGATVTEIPMQARGRYVKIAQTGREGAWWSIHELKINGLPQEIQLGPEIDRSTFTVQSDANGGSVGNIVDNNPGTAWSTGGNQKNGQALIVDLGSEKRVGAIVLEREKNRYPEKLQVFTSNDPANWGGSVTEYEGSEKLATDKIAIYPFPARYIKLQIAKDSNRPWDVKELKLYSAE